MVISYPKNEQRSFSPHSLEIRVDGLRKAALRKGSEVEIKFPENKTITLKSGMLCKLEFQGTAGEKYIVQGNWYFRNSGIFTTASLIIFVVVMNLVLPEFESGDVLKYLAAILIGLIFLLGFFHFFSNLCKLELVKVDGKDQIY